jgi:hypothetical protein
MNETMNACTMNTANTSSTQHLTYQVNYEAGRYTWNDRTLVSDRMQNDVHLTVRSALSQDRTTSILVSIRSDAHVIQFSVLVF